MWSILVTLLLATPMGAQQFPTDNPVLRAIWVEGTAHGQTWSLAQTLMDSIGPRLTGTRGQEAAADWVIGKYTEWGIEARSETYGTWRGWRRGITHVDLMEPRVRSLEAMMLAGSPGSSGMKMGEAVVPPDFSSPADLEAWLTRVEGKFVLLSVPQPTCRPDENWAEYATDNGTGTITMLEAMRILSEVYPQPKRTIIVGHWNGEEQGLNGSRSFAADPPRSSTDCRRFSTRTTGPDGW